MKRYENCIFDLYGTLADIRTDERSHRFWRVMARWYRDHGADYRPSELRDSYFCAVRQMEQAMGGPWAEIQLEQVFRRLFLDKGRHVSLELAVRTGAYFRRCSRRYIRLYDGAWELLAALHANGQGVFLLSNAQRIFTMDELKRLGIRSCFDAVYLSSDCGVKKPDRRFFDRLLREQNIPPETAVMVGNDGACDIRGAQAAGLDTMYVRSAISPREPLPEADYVLEDMDLARVREILTREAP